MTREYLRSPEEVVQALKEGKAIKTEHGHTYTLKDGFIVQTVLGKIRSVNATLFFDDRYYIECPKPLRLKVGEFYRTINGRKAFVYAKIGIDCPYPFCVVTVGNLEYYTVNTKGKRAADEQPLDLVSPWEDE